jgi:hypothetical protein
MASLAVPYTGEGQVAEDALRVMGESLMRQREQVLHLFQPLTLIRP